MEELALERADQFELVLSWGDFLLKRFFLSKRMTTKIDPPNNFQLMVAVLSQHGWNVSPVNICCHLIYRWIKLSQETRRKETNVFPFNLTRRQYLSKVTEVFDLKGKITQITATVKLNLCTLVESSLIHPNKRRFKTVVRFIAFVMKFLKNLREKGRALQEQKSFCLHIMS